MPNVPTNTIVSGLAAGIDRNDGKGGLGGTSSSPLQIVVNGAGGVVNIDDIATQEQDDSPTLERAEQCTSTHHFQTSYQSAKAYISIYSRGALTYDSDGNYYRVLSATMQYQKPGRALVTVIAESISFDVPPDEWGINNVKLGLDIFKHPRYFYSITPTDQIPGYSGTPDSPEESTVKQTIIRALQAYRENPFIPTKNTLDALTGNLHDYITSQFVGGQIIYFKNNPYFNPAFPTTEPPALGTMPANPATAGNNPRFYPVQTSSITPSIALAVAAASEIIQKLWRMEDAPMINGIELTWSEYYFRQPYLNLGGYIEDPITQANPSFPAYFYSPTVIGGGFDPDPSTTIFDKLTTQNPQCYAANGQYNGPLSVSWLRDADTFEYQRAWVKVTHKWLGSFIGTWDPDLNARPGDPNSLSNGNRPTLPSHYRKLIM